MPTKNKFYLHLKRYPEFITTQLQLLHTRYLFSKKRGLASFSKDKQDGIGDISNPSSTYFTEFDRIRKCVLEHTL